MTSPKASNAPKAPPPTPMSRALRRSTRNRTAMQARALTSVLANQVAAHAKKTVKRLFKRKSSTSPSPAVIQDSPRSKRNRGRAAPLSREMQDAYMGFDDVVEGESLGLGKRRKGESSN